MRRRKRGGPTPHQVREARRLAAEEFFARRNTPPTQVRPLTPEPWSPPPTPRSAVGIGEPGGPASVEITDWREGRELLRRLLAEGKIK